MPRYTWGFIAEYTGLGTLDTTGANHMGCDDATVQMTLAGQNETIILGFLEHGESGLTVTPSAGLTLETPGLSFGLIDGTATNSGSYTAGFDFGGPNLTFAPTWTALALAFEPPGPLEIPFVGSNGGSGFVATFPIASLSQIPACGPNDGACSLTLQITDGNGNVITSGSAGSVAIVKTFSGGTLTVPIVTIAPR